MTPPTKCYIVANTQIFLLQVVVESHVSAIEYGDLVVEEGSPVNPDLHFDSQLMHLYVMTEKMVSYLDK